MTHLAVSNLAWPDERNAAALEKLASLGVEGVEVAPTRLAGWEDLTPGQLVDYRHQLEAAGLRVSSLQAILFGCADLHLLGDLGSFQRLCEHMRRVTDIAVTLGAGVMVFGSPRNRHRGDMPLDAAWELARERWRTLGDITWEGRVAIGIEPVPAFYGGDFLAHWPDVLRMVQEVGNPGVRVHLDTGCVLLGGGDIADAIAACIQDLAHFHAAQPELGNFDTPTENHADAAAALKANRYARWLAIEMREQGGDPLASVETAVRTVQHIYWS